MLIEFFGKTEHRWIETYAIDTLLRTQAMSEGEEQQACPHVAKSCRLELFGPEGTCSFNALDIH